MADACVETPTYIEPPTYIVASNKGWHYPEFEKLKASQNGRWVWASDTAELASALAQHDAVRYVFFLHWSDRVADDVWQNVPCVCFHMTDLPYGRGGSPLQNLIVRGHSDTKLTAFRMVEAMDAGPVYLKRDLSLAGSAEDIYVRAGQLSAAMIRDIVAAQPKPVEQVGEPVLFKRRTPLQSELPNDVSRCDIYDFIRMLDADGYPHAFVDHGNMRIHFTDAELTPEGVTAKVCISEQAGIMNNDI